jgi:HEPN domain-containing protein
LTNLSLGTSYVRKATVRLDVLDLLMTKSAYSDVVREAQEVVELALKGMLRLVGVEPPKFHDVGGLLLEHRDRFPADIASQLEKAARISKKLRKERELAFYGDIDFIPTEEYSSQDAEEARSGGRFVARLAQRLVSSQGR